VFHHPKKTWWNRETHPVRTDKIIIRVPLFAVTQPVPSRRQVDFFLRNLELKSPKTKKNNRQVV
jgi:hypothetical protein